MDKYEYKIRSEEIKTLIAKGEYVDAAAIADTIDWRRVKSVMMLCTISDLYKINRRFEDARDMLLLAYDKHPGGRSIVYSLCELSIKMGEFVQAVEYYKEFVQVAPKDSGRYVLQYKLYEAQDVSLEERIAVLEELKSKDYSEKWAYELAYLYHRIGLATKCVEECDELILWFGEGKYVLKAMELKMLHEPLTAEQQERYNQMKGISQPVEQAVEKASEPSEHTAEEDLANAPTKEIPAQDLDIQVKLMGVGQYDTINIQKELAQNMKELWEGPAEASAEPPAEAAPEPSPEMVSSDTGIIDLPDEENEEEPVEPEETKVEEVFFGETGEMDTTAAQVMEEMKKETLEPEEKEEETATFQEPENKVTPMSVEMPKEFNKILGMEYDGQISMIMPETEQVEKQITGQIRLEDVLLEWEKMKKDSEQKRMEAVRQHVMEQTGAMFTEFDAAVRDGLLEKLEKGTDNDLPETEETENFTEAESIEEVQDMEETEDTPDSGEVEESIAADEMEETETADAGDLEEYEETGEFEDFEEIEELEEVNDLEEAEGAEEIEETEDLEEAEELVEEADEEDTFEEAEEADDTDEVEETDEVTEVEDTEDADEAAEAEDTEDADEAAEVEDTEDADEAAEAEDTEEADEVTEAEDTEEADEVTEAEDTEDAAEAEEIEEDEEAEETEDIEEAEDVKETEDTSEKKRKVRSLSPEERQLFGSYTQSKKTREQIVYAIDNISMAAYTGNVLITGEEGMDTLSLAKNLIKEVQQTDSNLTGRIAKISGSTLNQKGVDKIFCELANGALIVLKAGGLENKVIQQMCGALEQEHSGLIVILEDTKNAINKLLKRNPMLKECFNIRIDMEALDNDSLVAYGKKYAREQEYSIDELGVLALHTRIAERQTSDHAVTISEVKEILDEAIRHANRKTLGHFFDILVAKRYDDEDMIILREKDFI